ncbi:MAG: PilZ domain-containing protein [Candidatus Omnitrophota bacterium]
MFTKADYVNYFDQIARVERKMIYRSYDLGLEVADVTMSRVLKKIGDDEVRHYGHILKVLRYIEVPGALEKRRQAREYCLGTLQLSFPEPEANELRAYCVNLSDRGVCVEYEQSHHVEGTCDLVIHLFGKEDALRRRGKFVWSKEVEPGFHIAGVEFIP